MTDKFSIIHVRVILYLLEFGKAKTVGSIASKYGETKEGAKYKGQSNQHARYKEAVEELLAGTEIRSDKDGSLTLTDKWDKLRQKDFVQWLKENPQWVLKAFRKGEIDESFVKEMVMDKLRKAGIHNRAAVKYKRIIKRKLRKQ